MDDFNINIFELYTAGKLSEDDRLAFEKRLTSDLDFAAEYDSFKILKAGIRSQALQQKLATLKKNIHQDPSNVPIKKPRTWNTYLLVMGGLTLLVALLYFLLQGKADSQVQPEQKADPQIKETNMKPLQDSIQVDSMPFIPTRESLPEIKEKPAKKSDNSYAKSEATRKSLWQEAMELYAKPQNFATILRDETSDKDQKFKDALVLFNEHKYKEVIALIGNEKDEKSVYLHAHALLLSGKSRDAASMFRTFAKDDFSTYHEESTWYLTIALLANYPDRKDELVALTNDLILLPAYSDKAKEIKQKIK